MLEKFGQTLATAGAGCLLSAALLYPGCARAQQTDGLLQIQISPPGAAVELKGPENTLTASPNSIMRPSPGWYRLKASYKGYEDYTQTVYIDGKSPTSISGTLDAKGRWKAGARSIFLPGWGQYYSGRTATGVVFTVTTLGMALGYYFFDAHADNRQEEYDALRKQYDEASTVAEQEALQPAVEEALNNAYNADQNRVTWGYLTVGVYAYQILDAMIFFPNVPEVKMGAMEVGWAPAPESPLSLRASYEF